MNCWNTLRAQWNHNVAGNGGRDGFRILGIGQSAAKSLGSFKPFDAKSEFLNLCNIDGSVISPSTGSVLLKLKAGNGLFSFPAQIRKNEFQDVGGKLISPYDFVGGFTGRQHSCFNRTIKRIGKKFNCLGFAHRYFKDNPILVSVMRASASKPIDHDAAFSIDNSGKICNVRSAHRKLRRLTFNDYPEREYAQAGGRMRQSYLTRRWADDIVSSAMKIAAARKSGVRTSALIRRLKAYLGDDYYALAWPTTLRTFKNNLETVHQYSDTGFKLIMNGEIGRYENVRYVEQTNIAKGLGTTGISTANGGDMVAWVNGVSDWIFFFGNDTVAEAIAVPEEMRGKIPGNDSMFDDCYKLAA